MRVLMQPARRSEKTVEKHYQDTIASPVVFAEHADLLDPGTLAQLHALFPGGAAPMWGVMSGRNGANLPEIHKMAPGDWVCFSGDKRLYLGGTVAAMWRNADLAARLWGRDPDTNATWEHMYALAGTRGFDTPIEEIRALFNWKPKRNVMRFQALSQTESDLLQLLLTLEAAQAAPAAAAQTADDTETAIADFDGELERRAERAYRGEQAQLKRFLIPGLSGECALCGRLLPKAFLIAAHIKKRAVCTDDEKRDLANVAMLACLLGCDGLYERGYIGVDAGGVIRVSPFAAEVPGIAEHIDTYLAGRTVTWWTPQREKYFAWHRAHTFQVGPTP